MSGITGHRSDPVERVVRTVLVAGVAASVTLMVLGLVLAVGRGAELPRDVVQLADLPAGFIALEPAAYLSAGIVVLVGTPFVRVGGSLVAFAAARDRRYVFVSAGVLAVMCMSVALGKT